MIYFFTMGTYGEYSFPLAYLANVLLIKVFDFNKKVN